MLTFGVAFPPVPYLHYASYEQDPEAKVSEPKQRELRLLT